MNLDQLTSWRTSVLSVLNGIRSARITHDAVKRNTILAYAEETAVVLLNVLEQSGAEKKEGKPRGFDVPIHLLDTPANRRYAIKLREAWEAGLEVDRERYGEDIGTDGCAQMIEMVLADVEQEVYGAGGKVRE